MVSKITIGTNFLFSNLNNSRPRIFSGHSTSGLVKIDD